VVALLGVGTLAARGTGPAQPVAAAAGSGLTLAGRDPITGARVDLADYAGTPVVINVWGSWCHGCIEEAADLQTFVERHPEVQMLGLDLQDSDGAARAFYDEWDWSHPSIADPDGRLSFALGLQGTPTTFFLDEQHRVVTRIVGATDLAGFEQGLEQALSAG
jgi:thiol-disulfide isomerase/thioredoxin